MTTTLTLERENDRAPNTLETLTVTGNVTEDAVELVSVKGWGGQPLDLCDFSESERNVMRDAIADAEQAEADRIVKATFKEFAEVVHV